MHSLHTRLSSVALTILASHVLYAAPAGKSAGAGKAPPIESGKPAPETLTDTAVGLAANIYQRSASDPQFVIEDNVPMPERSFGGGRKGDSIYPFDKLGVQQSFYVKPNDEMPEPWKTLTSLASRQSLSLYPKVFKTAKETDKEGKTGVRVWRVADTTEPKREPVKKPKKGAGEGADPVNGNTAGAPDATNEPKFD